MKSHTNTNHEQRRSELAELRRELRDKQGYLSDDSEELWKAISQWILESYNVPVGSLQTKVQTEMAELQDDPLHKMYDHADVDDGEEAFPKRCKGCPHYGVQCPPLARYHPKKTFERILDESEDDDELQAELSAYAAKHHCSVLQEIISEWERGYANFLSRGEQLRTLLNADIKGIDLETVNGLELEFESPGDALSSPATPSPSTAAGHGDEPPAEAAERIETVTESIMTEDETEGEA
ncbi:hypothetical protein [Halosolutus gelatinilyticus]|uniref:hypothetical protein n=1 Tax=Halosolutus gelatinilyticus TaxID=2931975 RepID=UPI001FF2996F|nr:hypothetical protein [Halosolutus gelatinilyticus]